MKNKSAPKFSVYRIQFEHNYSKDFQKQLFYHTRGKSTF